MAKEYLLSKESKKAFMMCNEAIVRGALEADVKVVSFYPGTPTSGILDTFSQLSEHFDYFMEISANEKVALETVAGAAMAGVRSFTSMKSIGMNVASDALFTVAYTGVKSGMVCVVADDPHCHSSQSEQDGRFFGPNAYVPMLEPSYPQEAMDMVKWAFKVSEKFRTPVIVRTVTRVNHQSGMVQTGTLKREKFERIRWRDNPKKYLTIGESARELKLKLLGKMREIEEYFESSKFNKIIGEGDEEIGIITSSASYNYVLEALKIIGMDVSVLKLGTTYPLPKKLIGKFLEQKKTIIVVEELSPYLELNVTAIAKDANPDVKIFGKYTGHFSEALEYNTPIVVNGITKALEIQAPVDYESILSTADKLKEILPNRYPVFCAGCPHRATFYAVLKAVKGRNVVFNNDIGCYSMVFFPPVNFSDTLLCMGASLGLSTGMQYVVEEKVLAVVGDSTFFHACLPGLVNAVHHNDNFTLIVLDNDVTAMTGQQPHPGTDRTAGNKPAKKIKIEDVAKAIGVEHIAIVDPYDVKAAVEPIKAALDFEGPSLVVSRRACALHNDRLKRKRGEPIVPNYVDKNICKKPYTCIRNFHCPAIVFDEEDMASEILSTVCDGCGVCAKICPFGAIKPLEVK